MHCLQTWKPLGGNCAVSIKERIQRAWRPQDDESGGQPDQDQAPQDARPQDDAPQQPGDGRESEQGQPQQGGGNNPMGGGRGKRPGKPTMRDARKASQAKQKEQDRREQFEQEMADYHDMSLEEYRASRNPSRKKTIRDFWERMEHIEEARTEHEEVQYYNPETDEWEEETIEAANNPVETAEKVMQRMRQLAKEGKKAGYYSHQQGNFNDEDARPASKSEMEESDLYKASTKLNSKREKRTFDPATGESIRKLNASFAVLASKIAEDAVSWPTIGDDEWDVPAIMRRKYDKRPLSHCKQSREKSRLVLVLDTSPSCRKYAEFFQAIAQAGLAFGDVEIYDAPNGYVTHKLIPGEGWLVVSHEGAIDWRLQNRHVIFFGDWDGASNVIHNSQKSKMYWFDCDARHDDDFKENMWSGQWGFTYSHFKGKKYACYDVQDFIRLVKKIK